MADSNTGDESKVELVLDIRLNPVVRLAVGTVAAERDAGFDPEYFADMLRTVHRFDDEEFARYGVAPGQAAEIKKLADEWRSALRPPS
ncbi:hypothetical protein KGQ19_05260 [Catenulispora sp. NL8]|uniref:Uncharacterized protein n=1 Tax=Catenulispora pinistramenti TaxID=2705254 RepID=A0ABS5KJE1_9ACTN|nr:hypothetical protein [Catenulispora pinistramenti]MBS2546268.1 hypothetical protein [Catenulispora pinistramenti]